MNSLPLVVRELQVAARRPTAARLRTGASALALLFAVWSILTFSELAGASQAGQALLATISGIVMVGALASGVILTADCIARERREETLGLLFLTDLRPHDVVLGKLAANAIVPCYTVLGIFPALSVSVCLGGVTGGEFWRVVIAIIVTMLLSLSAGLFASTLLKRQQDVHVAAAMMIGFLTLGVAGSGLALGPRSSGGLLPHLSNIPALASPLTSYFYAFDSNYRFAAGWFWHAVLFQVVVITALIFGAARITLAAAQESGKNSDKRPVKLRTVSSRFSIDSNPIAWLVSQTRQYKSGGWLLFAGAAAVVLVETVWASSGLTAMASFVTLAVAHLAMKWRVAADAVDVLNSHRRDGTLESLLGSRLGEAELANGLTAAFRERYAVPVIGMSLLTFYMMVRSMIAGDSNAAFALMCAALALPFDVYCCAAVGFWRGLASAKAVGGFLSTVWQALAVRWLLFGILAGTFHRSSGLSIALAWLFFALISGLIVSNSARRRLREHFREFALRPYGARAPIVESKWSPINWDTEEARQPAVIRT